MRVKIHSHLCIRYVNNKKGSIKNPESSNDHSYI